MTGEKRITLFLTVFTIILITVLVLPPKLNSGPLEPPSSAVDENGNPVVTMRSLSVVFYLAGGSLSCSDFPRPKFGVTLTTVTDCDTGLTWDRNANRFGWNVWETAFNACADLELGGYGDWRLPEISELQSLADCTFGTKPCFVNTFGNGQWIEGDPVYGLIYGDYTKRYWSSTTSDTFVWIMNFNLFTTAQIYPTNSAYVWCVRGP